MLEHGKMFFIKEIERVEKEGDFDAKIIIISIGSL